MNSVSALKLPASLPHLIAIALIYYITAKLGQYLAIPPGFITPVYAPSGIAVAVLLQWGNHPGVGIWVAALIAAAWSLWANTGDSWMSIAAGLGIASGSVLQAWIGASSLQRWIGVETLFQKAHNVFKFAGIELLSCMISPTIGAGTMLLCGLISPNDFLNSWITFWLGDYVGVLVVAPLVLIWLNREQSSSEIPKVSDSRSSTEQRFQQSLEIGMWLVGVAIVGGIAFGMAYPIEYMLVPLLVWVSLRFGQRLTTCSILLIAGIALAGTIRGTSSFNRSTLNETLLLLQAFIGAMTLTSLVLSAAIVEREQAKTNLEQVNADLESKIAARTIELQLAKNHLEEQVQERTASLRLALTELTETHESLKQAQSHLVQTEKMSSLGQLVAGIAHEINNPLGFIHGNLNHTTTYTEDLLHLLDLYQDACGQPTSAIQARVAELDLEFLKTDLPKMLSSMRAGAERIKQIVLSLRNFSRLDEAAFKSVNVHEGIDNTLVILEHQLKATSYRPEIQVIRTYSQLPLIECYVGQLNQVFMNLLVNAIEAIDAGWRSTRARCLTQCAPTIRIDTELKTETAIIRIADNGSGMTEEVLQNIFNPFFTTKPVGQGTGLGLSISYQIVVERHQGSLQCRSQLDCGTEFIIEIPLRNAN